MKWFSDLSARAKLLCSFITLLTHHPRRRLQRAEARHRGRHRRGVQRGLDPERPLEGATRAGLRKFEVARLSHIIATTEEDLAKYDAELVQAANGINKDLSDYDRLIHNEEDRRHIAGVKESIAAFLSESETVIRLAAQPGRRRRSRPRSAPAKVMLTRRSAHQRAVKSTAIRN